MSKDNRIFIASSINPQEEMMSLAYSINSEPRQSTLDYLGSFCKEDKTHGSDKEDSKEEISEHELKKEPDDEVSEYELERESEDDLFFGDFDDADEWKKRKTPDRSVSPTSQEKLHDQSRGLS